MPRSSWFIVVLFTALLLAGVYVLLYQGAEGPAELTVAAVPDGDQEIAWLHPATTPYTWERFVAGMQYLADKRPDLGLKIDLREAFPATSTAMASVGLRRSGVVGTLWIRWCKLTGQHGQAAWLEALAQRQPPPLAIVGGGSSDRARQLAELLAARRTATGYAPPFLVTTATADSVFTAEQEEAPLLDIYSGRSFRCCYSNRQMAQATLDFIFSQPDLRPDHGPAYLVYWEDDPYSRDMMDQSRALLWEWQSMPEASALRRRGELGEVQFVQLAIRHSIGPVTEPNPPEAEAIQKLVDEAASLPELKRALLFLPGEVKPTRRVLRSLVQAAPALAPRFVVATGDAVDFNVIFRDRHLAWPLQELPCTLLLFCHRNPVQDAAGFAARTGRGRDLAATSSGTHDLLLYADVGAALVEATFADRKLLGDVDQVTNRLRAVKDEHGQARFDERGERPGGRGEFVVLLRPLRRGDRVLPQATIVVSERGVDGDWRLVREFQVEDTGGPGP